MPYERDAMRFYSASMNISTIERSCCLGLAEEFTQLHKSAYDKNADLDRAGAIENRCCHLSLHAR